LAPGLRLASTTYQHDNEGRGLWYTPYTASPDGTPIALRTTEYAIDRQGVTSTLSWDAGDHQWRASFWYENNDFDQARRFYATSSGAVPSPYAFPQNPFSTAWAYAFNTKTHQFSLSDTVALGPALSLSAGFKALQATIVSRRLAGTGPAGEIRARQGFLPQLGLNHRLGEADEVFAGVSRNMRVFQGAATGTTPFATTQAGFDAIQGNLRPETSTNVELGWRRSERLVQAALTAYWVDFQDRLLGVTQGSAILGNPTVLSNVGGVRTQGLEATLSLRLRPGLSWYSSLSLSRSTYRDDVLSRDASNQTNAVPIAGKDVVDAPRTLFKSLLSYDDGRWFGEAGVDFVSRRYYSYVNDASVPSRTLLNLSAGLRLPGVLGLSEGSVRLGVSNLGNRRYVATLGSNGFPNRDPSGRTQTLLPGAPRQLVVTFSGKL
jgi:iron complex outermembrane receptor protein